MKKLYLNPEIKLVELLIEQSLLVSIENPIDGGEYEW